MTTTRLARRFDALPLDYRIIPTHDGFELQYREPCRFLWKDVYDGLSVAGCLRAYEQIREGETPSIETCEPES